MLAHVRRVAGSNPGKVLLTHFSGQKPLTWSPLVIGIWDFSINKATFIHTEHTLIPLHICLKIPHTRKIEIGVSFVDNGILVLYQSLHLKLDFKSNYQNWRVYSCVSPANRASCVGYCLHFLLTNPTELINNLT